MKFPARLTILLSAGSHTAWFTSVEDGKKVLDDFAAKLALIKEYGNRDEEPIFRFTGAGAFYAVDLRKAHGASLSIIDEWTEVALEDQCHTVASRKEFKAKLESAGLGDELRELERRDPKAA